MKTTIRLKRALLFTILLWSATLLLAIRSIRMSLYGCIMLIEWLIFLAGLFSSLINHSISETGIHVCFLSFPVRSIPWKSVKHAIYVHTWRDPRARYYWGPTHGQIIYVTLKAGIRFLPELDVRLWHKLRHPFSTVCLWLPNKNVRLFTEAFEQYYPGLERQTQASAQHMEYVNQDRRH